MRVMLVGLVDYDASDEKVNDQLVHLTNIAVQRRDQTEKLSQAVLSMADLQLGLASEGIPEGWVMGDFSDQMKASMAAVIAAAASKFDSVLAVLIYLGLTSWQVQAATDLRRI